MRPDQKEIGRAEIIEVEGVPSLPLTSPTTDDSQLSNDVDWKRAAGTPCRYKGEYIVWRPFLVNSVIFSNFVKLTIIRVFRVSV